MNIEAGFNHAASKNRLLDVFNRAKSCKKNDKFDQFVLDSHLILNAKNKNYL